MINYNTKFKIGDTVLVKSGLLCGKIGKIVDYSPATASGLAEDNSARRRLIKLGIYTIKTGWFSSIMSEEENLELL